MFNSAPRIPLLLSALLCSSLLLSGCNSKDAPAPVQHKVLVQPVVSAQQNAGNYSGEIRARHEADLSFRVSGKMIARLVDAGAEVKPGQALAKLDPADLQLAAQAAKAQLTAAESDLTTTRADRNRYQDLFNQKFVSKAAFDAKENAFKSAKARAEQARSQSQISGNQAAYGTLTTEYPAIVTAVLAEPGQILAAGQAVLRIARPEEKEVLIAVPEGRIAELKAATEVTINLWAAPTVSMTGELRELAPAADPATRTYAARIRIHNPPAQALIGMTARVSLGNATGELLLVPLAAVVDQGNGSMVWTVQDGKATPHPVKVAQFREDGVSISDGLKAGELVVITGTNKLVSGQSVEAQLATPPAQQH